MASKNLEGNKVGSSSNTEQSMRQLSVAILSLEKTLSSAKALLNITRPRTTAIDEAVNLGNSLNITHIHLSMGLFSSLDPVQSKIIALSLAPPLFHPALCVKATLVRVADAIHNHCR